MGHKALDQFGAIFIQEVRDASLWRWEAILGGHMKGDYADRMRTILASDYDRQLIAKFVPEIVDSVLFRILFMIEEHPEIFLNYCTNEGETFELREISDGLPGELYTEDGWIQRFSSSPPSMIDTDD